MSKYSERDIAIEAVKIVEEHGELNMTDMIEILTERMKPNGHDIKIIKERKDSYFSQKVRNLKSHRNKIFYNNVIYEEVANVTFYRSFEIGNQLGVSTKKEVKKNIMSKKKRARKFYARKIEFDKLNAERKDIGNKGELFVLEDQRKKVKKFAPKLVNKVNHVSKNDGDGAGYDILSFDDKYVLNYIEVKSTEGQKKTPFYMSINEYEFYQLHKNNFLIARVYEFDTTTCTGKIVYIKGSEFDTHFQKEINSFKVKFR